MNKCIFIGNLTKDPELTTTASGVALCRFSIAVGRSFKRDGEPEADFFNIVTWRGLAENCHKFLSKGSKVCVIGSMQNHSYDDKDGNKRYVSDVIADEVEFVSSRNSGASEGSSSQKPSAKNDNNGLGEPVTDDTLPF